MSLKNNAKPEENFSSRESNVRLSEVIDRLLILCRREPLTLGEFLHALSVYGHMIVCLVFAVPFLIPVPLPGLSTIFGLVIGIAGSQILLGQDPWVPKSWRHRELSVAIIVKILDLLKKILLRTEKVIKPRLKFFARHPGFVKFNGAVILFLALLLALPMPPGFNFPPALAIIVLAIGSIERDGILVIAGYALSMVNMVLFGAFFALGFEGLKAFLHS